jgi:hypothetical protein
MSEVGTKRNCRDAHGISGAEGRPAVPSVRQFANRAFPSFAYSSDALPAERSARPHSKRRKCRKRRHHRRTAPREGRRLVDRPPEEHEPRLPELGLKAELPCGPFRRRPQEGENDGAAEDNLAPEDFGSGHGGERLGPGTLGPARASGRSARSGICWRANRKLPVTKRRGGM